MKYITIALIFAVAVALNLKGEDGLVKFDFNPSESDLFGLVLKGQIDPKNEINNKIETFLKLANYYIPILESVNNEANNLKWAGTYSISLGPFTFNVWANFNLVVGWEVTLQQGSSALNGTFFNVMYAPFAWGWASSMNQLQSNWLGNGWYNGTLYYTRSYVNISLQIYADGDVCFTGVANMWPVQLITNLTASLQSCQAEILNDIIYGIPVALVCNFSTPYNQTHLNISFTQNYTNPVVNTKCFYL